MIQTSQVTDKPVKIRREHKYTLDELVWFNGQRVTIRRLLWTVKGTPVYDVFGFIYPIHEEHLSLEKR